MGNVYTEINPAPRTPRVPNCTPEDKDTADAIGLVHDWKHISEDGPGDVYRCARCGCIDVD